MKLTSATASKLLRELSDDKNYITSMESNSYTYVVTDGEEPVIPDYDYDKTQASISEIDSKIIKIKHAINCFNTTTELEGLGITIDQALVEMAQLSHKKFKYDSMRKCYPKERVSTSAYSRLQRTEYKYANYNIEKASEDYKMVNERITSIQLALDLCNQTKTFEVDI